MATIKEVGAGSSIPLTEVSKPEQNGFSRFIEGNHEVFDRHSFLTYELRDEEAGWKKSSTLDAIVSIGVNLNLLLQPQLNRATSKQMRRLTAQVRTNIENCAFGTFDDNAIIAKYFSMFLPIRSRSTPESQALIETLGESLIDFKTSFHEARVPLVLGIRESKAELMGKLEHFLLLNPSNIIAFADFLSDKKNNGAKIEAIRPFLSSLADSEQMLAREKKEGTLRRVTRKWLDELKEKPSLAIIDEFANSIKSKPSNIREWLEFAAQGEDIAIFLKDRSDASTWASELREALSSFVSSRYLTACTFIERELGELRRPSVLKPTLSSIDFELENVKRAPGKIAVKKERDVEDETLETAERSQYPVGILTKEAGSSSDIRILTEEEWMRRLQKEADSFAPDDQRMLADLERMFSSLRNDPYGLGTEKFTAHTVGVENRRIPLRSFNSRKRIGLPHDHPDSHHLRIVYVISRNSVGSVIGLDGIYRHEDYLKKFT